jgi:sugar/nucleoside kinase (ribokinase family)
MNVNERVINAVAAIIFKLNQNKTANANAVLGFDACIDNIVKVVKHHKDDSCSVYFSSSKEFGEFLIDLENRSSGVEYHTKLSKSGGNMVIMANALGNLGISIDCIGTFGLPEILPVFRTMSDNCSLYTVGDTITATALEFKDSKVIMFDPGPYNELSWQAIKDILGIERIIRLFSAKQLVSFLNWSEIENTSQIWEGILDEILPYVVKTGPKPYFLTDFSDCSRRSKKEIQLAISLLSKFRDYFKVVLSLNRNEAKLIALALDISTDYSDEEFIKSVFGAVNSDIVIIHRTEDALAYDGTIFEKCSTFFCNEPKILTGAGDNFNAGFCFSILHNFDIFQSLIIANAVSGYYVRTATSPDVNKLIDFIKQNSCIILHSKQLPENLKNL